MSRDTAKALMILIYVLMFILALIFASNKNAIYCIALGAIIAVFILSRFLRCPSCGKGQGKSWLTAQYCPYCGADLYDT